MIASVQVYLLLTWSKTNFPRFTLYFYIFILIHYQHPLASRRIPAKSAYSTIERKGITKMRYQEDYLGHLHHPFLLAAVNFADIL
jgi:hypothetical protein